MEKQQKNGLKNQAYYPIKIYLCQVILPRGLGGLHRNSRTDFSGDKGCSAGYNDKCVSSEA